ncbi:MAG: DNA-processing protein DprA [Planctomycetes bacterium]|nr:DNA-processing protein DprA [Planctomycetota bacterium]
MESDERDALLTLTLASGLAPLPTRRLLDTLGSARAVLEAERDTLVRVGNVRQATADKVYTQFRDLADGRKLDAEKRLIEEHRVTLLATGDPAYPALLRHIGDPPPLLFVRGRIEEGDSLALGMVGSRKCSLYGREQADRFASLCASAGLCIVSGGAYGVDAAAHRAALRAGGRTIAVLGSGLANPYPTDHRDLFDEIASGDEPRGAVVSELPMTAPPIPENFPARNRIISGLSLGVLVVEASLRSGALITARLAAEDHGREVMAIPGRVDNETAAGCHKIIREGWATLVTSAADVLDVLGEAGQTLKAAVTSRPGETATPAAPSLFEQQLTETQRRVTDALAEPRSIDQVVAATNLPAATVQADLTMLQVRGVVAKQDGRFVIRRR